MIIGRLLGFGVAGVAVWSLVGLGVLLRPDPFLKLPEAKVPSVLARSLSRSARDAADGQRLHWTITKATAALHTMVVDVDAERLEDARAIAGEIVEPVRSRGYEEILIYVRHAGSSVATVRRIQWTARGGYVESTYTDR